MPEFKITQIKVLSIAQLKEAARWYRDAFGLPISHTEEAALVLFVTWLQQQDFLQEGVSDSLLLEQLAEKIIDRLDDYSREYDSYEYGIPTMNDEDIQKMKEIVVQVLNGNDH